jgi:RNA methyltransferase, TrmH family
MLSKAKAKDIQSLGHKKQRDKEGLFIAEGSKIVSELLQSAPQYVKEVYAVKKWIKDNGDHQQKKLFIEVSEEELEKLSQLKTPNQVVAVVKKFEEETITVKGKISLVLDAIQDPGNLGTIIRIADWFGVTQVICSKDCADVYNPKVVQATMASIVRVKVFYTGLLSWLKEQKDIPAYAMMLEGKDITKMNVLKEGLIIIGNESKGIQEEIAALANERITIPKKGKAESLNAAVAAGIVLSHIVSTAIT